MCVNLVIRLLNKVLRTQFVAQKMVLAILTEIGMRGKSRALTELGESVPARNGESGAAAITTFLYALKAVFTACFTRHTLSASVG